MDLMVNLDVTYIKNEGILTHVGLIMVKILSTMFDNKI